MRVLQLCTDFRAGGIQRHVLDLTDTLRERGHRVFLAGTAGDWMQKGDDADFLALDLDGVAEAGGALPRRLSNAASAALRLRAFLRRERIQLIHAHESAPALVASLAAIGTTVPTVVTYHGAEPGRVALFGRIARFAARRIIATCHRSADELREAGGVPAAMITVIGMGVGGRPPVDVATRQRLRAELLGAGGRRLVVSVARLAHQKGIDVLVEVVRRTSAERGDIRYVVVGDGPLRDDVTRWVAAAGVERYVTVTGLSNRPHEYLAAGDAFLFASRWEALPIAIVEAFQAGLPVIATDAGGTRELVDDSVGKVVAIGDVGALSGQVLAILADDGLRVRLSENALERARERRFSPGYIHGQVERLYADVLGLTIPGDAHG
jgi:glycosyltransferase involved in cell wall biosynthesis